MSKLKLFASVCGAVAFVLLTQASFPTEAAASPSPFGETDRVLARTDQWWRMMGDPVLEQLVDAAMAKNLTLEQIAARVDQAKAGAAAARASQLPNFGVQGQGAAVRQSIEDPAVRPFANLPGFPRDFEFVSANLAASWEIDLFGGAPKRRAARASAEAAAADLAAARIAIAAETATTWLNIRELQQQASIARERQALFERQLIALDAQFARGLVPSTERDRFAAEVEAIRIVPQIVDTLAMAETERLGVLVADPDLARRLADEAAITDWVLPSERPELEITLASRPDILAAERRMIAADARLAQSRAQRLPKLSLLGFIGTLAGGPAALFTEPSTFAQASAGLAMPLFDFGRINALVADSTANRRVAIAAWQETVLQASAEVESASLILVVRAREAQAEALKAERVAASFDAIYANYEAGIVDLAGLVAARINELEARERSVAAKIEAARASISLMRATATGVG